MNSAELFAHSEANFFSHVAVTVHYAPVNYAVWIVEPVIGEFDHSYTNSTWVYCQDC